MSWVICKGGMFLVEYSDFSSKWLFDENTAQPFWNLNEAEAIAEKLEAKVIKNTRVMN